MCLLFLSASNLFSQVMTDNYVQGLVPFGSYDFGTFDIVGLSNGNLHFEIPFAVFKQRGLRDQIPKYQYDTPNWVKTFYPAPMQGQQGSYVITEGLIRDGGAVQYDVVEQVICTIAGVNYSTRVTQNYTVTDLHGGVHQLALRTQTSPSCGGQTFAGPTLDASGIWVDISGGTTIKVIYPDGTTAIQDTNGNFTSFSAASGSTTTTDTLGRTWTTQTGPTVTLTSPKGRTQQTPSSLTYTFKDSSGNPIPVKIAYGLWDIDTDLCGVVHAPCIEDSGTKVLPAAITIPSNSATPLKYVFTWNGNGAYDLDLTRLDLPTGAYITYSYGTRNASIPSTSRTIVSKPVRRMVTERDIFDGQNLRTWTFDTATIAGTVLNRPDGNREEHYFAKPCNGDVSYESEVRFYTGATLTKKIAKDYLCESGPSGFLGTNVRVIRETTTLDSGQVSKTEYDYETFPYMYLGQSFTAVRPNIIEKREYDFQTGTTFPLLRRTTHAYLHTTGTAYKNLNIVDRVTTETIFDGAGTQLSQTVNEYDNYAHTNLPMQASGATQHGSTLGTSYLTRGNVTAVKHWRNTDGALLTMVSQYDDAGNVIASVDPLSNKTAFDYTDSWANASCAPSTGQSKSYLTKMTDPAGNVTAKTYFSCPGLLASITDPNLQVTSFTYDPQNRADTTTYPDGGQVDIDHDDANRWIRSRKLVTATSNPIVSYARFDRLNRVIQRQLCEDGTNTCTTSIMTDFTYDPIGRPQTASNPHRGAVAATDGITTYAYDVLGRPTMIIPPDGTMTSNNVSTSYVGSATTVTDQVGSSRKSQTDALGRITTVWEDPNGLNFETDYVYTALDNLKSVTQKGATTDTTQWRVRNFTYNSLSQLTNATNPEAGSISYTYDANGNVLTKTAPAPNQLGTSTVTTTYHYDSSNRPTQKDYSDGSTATVRYGYDGIAVSGCTTAAPALTDSYPKGHRTTMCDASGAPSWAHDQMGRVLTEKRIVVGTSPWTKTAGYTYFLDGSVKTTSNPGVGRVMTYTLDAAGRPISVVNTAGPVNFVTNATYSAFGGLSTFVNGNTPSFAGLTVSNSYDKRLQPSAISVVSPSQTILSLGYDFGLGTADNGNVNKIINNRDGNRTQNFLYDSLNRIQQAYTSGPNWGETFSPVATGPGVRPSAAGIDAWGNLTNRSGVIGKANTEGLSAAPANSKNQLNGYCHDAAGNLGLNGPCPVSPNPYNPVYTYDAENRLKSTAGWTYIYDGDGHRVKKLTEAQEPYTGRT
jgi:YD repeat-containing protein